MDQSKKASASEIKKLIALNDELENYFRNTIIPQLFIDANLILRKFTPPAMRQFKLTMEDIGKPFDQISDRIRFPTFLENIREVIDTGEYFEKEIQTTDLSWFQMNILPYKVFEENKTNGVIITFVDITNRIKDLKEIEKLIADHETFIYSVSHDLKGPISNLEGLIDNLKQLSEDTGEEYKMVLEMFASTVEDIRKFITELADVARTRNNFTKEAERVNIENILEDVQLTLKERIISSKAVITTKINVSEITFIRKNIRSIVYNLLNNAIKYKAPKRAPEILIKTEKLDDDYIVLSVSDNGIGMEENQKKIIFSEFFRLNEEVEGTGMGLYIVSKMVDNSEGKIEVESIPGKGTTFKIFFKTKI